MQPVRRPRIPSSVAIRSSSSPRQRRESRSQSRLVGERSAGSVSSAARMRSSGMPAGLAGLHERDAAQRDGRIAALVAAAALGGDQALALVEAQRRLRHAAARGELPDGQFAWHLT